MRRSRPKHRLRPKGRIRAVLSLGLLLGVTQVGTLASWTDSATVTGGGFTSGTLDLRVGENAANQLAGPGGSWQHATLKLDAMAPGESVARALTVGNGGSVKLTYNATVTTSNNDLLNALQLTVVDGASVANTGSAATNNRVGTCTGGTATQLSASNVSMSPLPLLSAPATLTAGTSRTYCVLAQLAGTAPNEMQGKSATLTLAFSAAQ